VPEVFELLDSGELRLIDASPPDEYSVALAAAELSCPTRAISVVGE
jgi:ferredoxin